MTQLVESEDTTTPVPPAGDGEAENGARLGRRWRRYVLQGLLFTLAGSFIVATLTVDETWWEHLGEFPVDRALTLAGMVLLAWLCNGSRTWTLSRALGHPLRFVQSLGITLSMEFAIAATPGGVGGLASRLAFQRKAGIPLHVSMTMIAADLCADLLFFCVIAPFGLVSLLHLTAVHRLLARVPWETLLFAGVALAALLTAVALLLYKDNWVSFAMRHPRLARFRLAPRWRAFSGRIKEVLGRVWHTGMHLARRRPLHFFASLCLASIQWFCRYGVLVVILHSFGVRVDFLALLVLQGMLFFLGLLVIAPGGGGSVEILSTLILKPMAGAQVAGLSVIVWRIFTYYLYVAAGGMAFLFLSTRGKQFWRSKRNPGALEVPRE